MWDAFRPNRVNKNLNNDFNTSILVFRYEMRFKPFRPKRVKKSETKNVLSFTFRT